MRCHYFRSAFILERSKAGRRRRKKITWLSDGDNGEYMSVFDYDYAWKFSDELNKFGQGSDITGLLAACRTLFDAPDYKAKAKWYTSPITT